MSQTTHFRNVIALAILFCFSSLYAADPDPRNVRIAFPGHAVMLVAEVADTVEKRMRGLGGKDILPDGHGMLFVFDKDNRLGYWMKDMRFPIDILWFDSRLRLVSIAENATPESYPKVYRPRRPARYVLEVPAGFVSRNHIVIGDMIMLMLVPSASTLPFSNGIPAP